MKEIVAALKEARNKCTDTADKSTLRDLDDIIQKLEEILAETGTRKVASTGTGIVNKQRSVDECKRRRLICRRKRRNL